jgi:putative ABC transport system substrate-binding protein
MRYNTVGRIVVCVVSILGLLLIAVAQPPTKVHRIGLLSPGFPPSESERQQMSFLQGLRDLGYVEGHNFALEARWAETRIERLPGLAAELVRLKVDVIHAQGGAAAGAAKQATDTIPIVIVVGDPVAQGLVASLAHPGGNITGLSNTNIELSQKRLEIFKEALPSIARVAVLWCPGAGTSLQQWQATQHAAHALAVQLLPLEVRGPDGFETLIEAAARERVDGLVVLDCNFIPRHIVALAAQHRLPAIYALRNYVTNGGLMSYGTNTRLVGHRTAVYVDKILKGAKPADLPVEQSIAFELVINLKTAKALGVTISPTALFLADEVIQ